MSESVSEASFPAPFGAAAESVRRAVARPELELAEITAPAGLAPYAMAFAGDVRPQRHGIDSVLGTGRFVLLYDPEEPEAWGGCFRVICFAQAPLETDIGVDPFVADVAWSWLIDALELRRVDYHSASGTATTVLSTGFGELSGQSDGAQLEIRASWTPADLDFASHLEGWSDLVCQLAGLPPTADAVSLLPDIRASRD